VTIEATGRAWEQAGGAAGEVREMSGAVDETFLEPMLLVFQDVPTGDMVQAAVADERSDAPWHVLVAARLQALGTPVLDCVSDRAKALLQRAAHGCDCVRIPDCFHRRHDMVKRYALTRARQVRHARPALTHAEAVRARSSGLASRAPER
jgi:hypothetical protein